jgi:histidinol-phosphatase (PHP family)
MKFNETHDLFDPAHPRYQEAAEKAFRKLLEAPVRFEWNAGGMARGYRTEPYPAETFIERLCALGRPPIYASDCHDARFLLYGAELYEATVGSRC